MFDEYVILEYFFLALKIALALALILALASMFSSYMASEVKEAYLKWQL